MKTVGNDTIPTILLQYYYLTIYYLTILLVNIRDINIQYSDKLIFQLNFFSSSLFFSLFAIFSFFWIVLCMLYVLQVRRLLPAEISEFRFSIIMKPVLVIYSSNLRQLSTDPPDISCGFRSIISVI